MRYTLQQIKDGTGFRPGAQFEEVTDYNGWPNRETWAVALHINNDQGWQESVLEALREAKERNEADYEANPDAHDPEYRAMGPSIAGDLIRENVEDALDYEDAISNLMPDADALADTFRAQSMIRSDIGSLWRVDWTELGRVFLSDLDES